MPDLSVLVDLIGSLQMLLVSVSRNIAGDLFAEMHGHSLVFLLTNDLFMTYYHPLCTGVTVVLLSFGLLFAVRRCMVDVGKLVSTLTRVRIYVRFMQGQSLCSSLSLSPMMVDFLCFFLGFLGVVTLKLNMREKDSEPAFPL